MADTTVPTWPDGRPLAGRSLKAYLKFADRLAELGATLLEPGWLGAQVPHRVRCAKGHDCIPWPTSVASGRGVCAECGIASLRLDEGRDAPLKGRSLASYLKFTERLKDLGAELLEPHWLGADRQHRVRCAAGHDCTPRPNNVNGGGGVCGKCAGNDPTTAEGQTRDLVAQLGGTPLWTDWLGADKPHKVRCAAGHECEAWRSHLRNGGGFCKICAGQDQDASRQRFVDILAAHGSRMVGAYTNVRTPVLVRCRKGHSAMATPGYVKAGGGVCAVCRGKVSDIFYVVTGPEGVKFGVTSTDPRPRLSDHKSDGYGTVERLREGLKGAIARDLERELIALLKAAGVPPVRGREYYPIEALQTILHVVDDRLG